MKTLAISLLSRLLCASLFPLLLFGSVYGFSQETTTVALMGCRAADFNTNFQLIDGPTDDFTVVFDMRIISGHACSLDRGSYGTNGSPTFPDRTDPWGKVFVLSRDSNDRVWGTGKFMETAALLEPGKSAYFSIRWRTKPVKENDPCIHPLAVNWPVHIVVPSLLKPLCSEIEVSAFSLSAASTPAELKGETGQDSNPGILALTSVRNAYHKGEGVLLHVFLPTNDAASSISQDIHPTIYLRQRSSDGMTEFRETTPLPSRGCEPGDSHVGMAAPILEEIDWKKGFDLDPDFCGSVVWPKRRGDYSFQVFKTTVSSGATIRFVDSNILHIQFEEAMPLHRNSGPTVELPISGHGAVR